MQNGARVAHRMRSRAANEISNVDTGQKSES